MHIGQQSLARTPQVLVLYATATEIVEGDGSWRLSAEPQSRRAERFPGLPQTAELTPVRTTMVPDDRACWWIVQNDLYRLRRGEPSSETNPLAGTDRGEAEVQIQAIAQFEIVRVDRDRDDLAPGSLSGVP
jgi:hypothetical protein